MNNQNQKPVQEQAPETSITPQESSKKLKFPTWLSVLGIVIAAVIVLGSVAWGGYELFKPAPPEETGEGEEQSAIEDEFADWKTYQNEEYGFEVKYPKDWTSTENSKEQIVFFEPGSGPSKEHLGDIFINIINNSKKLSIDEYIKVKPPIVTDKGNITMDGKTAKQILQSGMLEFLTTIIPAGDYFIEITKEENYQEERDEAYNKILSTFKFLEPDETAEKAVEKFYNWYLGPLEKYDKISDLLKASNYFVNDLMDWEKIDGYVGADPLICAQEVPNTRTYDKAIISDDKATVIAHHIYSISGDNPITVNLKLIDGEWKINDIICD